MQKQTKQRTYAVAKFEQFEPSVEVKTRAQAALVSDKAMAATQKDLLNYALEHKQDDLLYFKATYATCGFNLNDDVFVNDEFWAARFSPVLKPTDWQHKDKDIIGVIYAVEAQYLDGTQIDVESDVVPKDDFELVVYGVVYKYTFAQLADEIEKRSKAGNLYVSMETWFSDFAYALLDKDSSRMKVVGRNDRTMGLDKYLRAFGGSGEYNGQRIGRVLKGMTFGGMGIVDQPANPRSNDGQVIASTTENLEMQETKETVVAAPVVVPVVADAKVTELESTVASLNTEKATAAQNLKRAEEKAQRAEDAKTVAEGIVAALSKAIDSAVAGFGTAVPAEIASIDAAQTADAKYAAMISWISKTSNETFTAAAALKKEVESLKAQVAAFEQAKADAVKAALITARTTEVETLFGKDAVATLMKSLSELSDEVYKSRIEELKLVASKAQPTVRHDGAAGTPDAEGASGEGKAGTGPRGDRKISVAAALENAEVEPALESGSGGTTVANPFDGLAALVFKNKE